jgi:NAD(P)H-hydrate epimerase
MATGGSGDVLTGLVAALIGQGMPAFDAAVLGAHAHGLAGDRAAKALGASAGLAASDLLAFLPAALRSS